MATLVSNIPLWVYPLFLGLLWLGLRATRDRSVSLLLMLALPLLGLLGLNRAWSLTAADTAVTGFVVAMMLGAGIGFMLQRRWIIAHEGTRLRVRGEWVTLLSMMSMFLLSFATGMMQGVGLTAVETVGFAAVYGACAGAISGVFLGRAAQAAVTWRQSAA